MTERSSTAAAWRAEMRAQAEAAGRDDRLEPFLRFCDRHDLMMRVGLEANLWNFGYAKIFAANDDEAELWLCLLDLSEPTGASYADLLDAWEDLAASDMADLVDRAGDLQMVEMRAVLTIFTQTSPWAKELFDNVQPAMRRAMAKSGLGEALGLTDALGLDGPMPSLDVVRHQAFRGPYCEGAEQ